MLQVSNITFEVDFLQWHLQVFIMQRFSKAKGQKRVGRAMVAKWFSYNLSALGIASCCILGAFCTANGGSDPLTPLQYATRLCLLSCVNTLAISSSNSHYCYTQMGYGKQNLHNNLYTMWMPEITTVHAIHRSANSKRQEAHHF